MADFGFDWDAADNDLLEPMVEDKEKELEVKQLEHKEENLGPFEVFCQRSASVYIYQRVWAAKEVGRLLATEESREVAMGELIPIAKRLAEDNEVFVRETMAQNLEPVLEYFYRNNCRSKESKDEDEDEEEEEEDFGAWLHRVLLTPHTSVSLPTQRAVVALGKKLDFDTFHTKIVHGVVLGLVQNPVQLHLQRQRRRTKDMVVKSRASDSSSSNGSENDELDISAVLEEEEQQQQKQQKQQQQQEGELFSNNHFARNGGSSSSSNRVGSGFFVSPADDEARVEQTRRKLLMLHMIHLVAAEFGAAMRPAVFVPVVERAAKDAAFEVRRDAAAVLGSLAKAVSADLAIDVLFPCFQRLAQDSIWQVRQSAARHALPGLALVLASRTGAFCDNTINATAEPYAYENQIQRSVTDKQWLQLIERLTGPREQSQHVRAAVFESIGRLALALVECPRSRDALVSLAINDVSRTPSHDGVGRAANNQRNSNGNDDEDEDDDGNDNGDEDDASNARPPARSSTRAAVSRDVVYQCAYNFPALLASLGSNGWDRLRDIYMQLSKSDHRDARQTLASSLHEVARILAEGSDDLNGITVALNATRLAANRISSTGVGTKPTSTYSADLESVLCLFLIDAPEIKMAALRNLGDALAWLTPASRVRCLPMILQVFKHDGKQWRTREMMACQLVKLCQLFPASTVVASLLPLAVEWAHDPVAGVRAAVAPAFPIVFELTKLDPSTQVRFFESVISFSHAASFRGRLFFVEICAALLAHDQDPEADPVDFDQFFLPSLAALAADRVANVRIALARLVRRMLENRERRHSVSLSLGEMKDSSSPTTKSQAHHRSVDSMPRRRARRNTTPMRAHLLATMLQQLSSDKDRDVQDIISSVKNSPPKKNSIGISNLSDHVSNGAATATDSTLSLAKFPHLSDETSAVSLPESSL